MYKQKEKRFRKQATFSETGNWKKNKTQSREVQIIMKEYKEIQVALLGLGTVGLGVYKVLQMQKEEMQHKIGTEIKIKKILVRNLEKAAGKIEDASVLTNNWQEIVNDDKIQIVIEVMGGMEPARTYIMEAMQAGKQVVTANKDLIAADGKELMDQAKKSGCDLLFEAAVAGAIPIIRPLKQCLAGNHLSEIMGIVNGTTNFILTKMAQDGMEFEEALALATELGYAEADPTADIEGLDAGRKVAIMASIAFNSRVTFDDVYTEGITKITAEDIKYATSMGTAIKLLATSRKVGNQYYAMVSPVMIDAKNPLYSVNGVFNAIFIHGNVLGDAMFYGSGAGKLPTASAVVADVVDCAKNKGRNIMMSWSEEKLDLLQIDDVKSRFFVRVSGHAAERQSEIEELFGKVEIVAVPSLSEEFAFITGEITEQEYREKAEKLDGIQSRIRARI